MMYSRLTSPLDASLVRWGAKAVGGLTVNLVLLAVWVDAFGVPAEFAVLINWVVLAVVGYTVTDLWVYADGHSPKTLRGHLRRLVALQSVMASSKLLNYVVYVALLYVDVQYQVAWVAGAVVTFALSYGGSRYLWHRH